MSSDTTLLLTPAGLGVRAVSYTIDAVVIVAVAFVFSALLELPTVFDLLGAEVLPPGAFKTAALTILIGALYHAGMEVSKWQTTIGKRALGLTITNMDGERIGFFRTATRFIINYLVIIFMPLLIIVLVLNAKKRGVHDLITDTRVYKSE